MRVPRGKPGCEGLWTSQNEGSSCSAQVIRMIHLFLVSDGRDQDTGWGIWACSGGSDSHSVWCILPWARRLRGQKSPTVNVPPARVWLWKGKISPLGSPIYTVASSQAKRDRIILHSLFTSSSQPCWSHPSMHLSIHPFTHPFIHSFIHFLSHPSIHLFIQ